ncbi:MAG: threonylcarbamoyl-AMP synthase, partial [Clostridiales bacterium]|nr:threonylcarbamoyl-AMP synthase [Clostridiales bacterium]
RTGFRLIDMETEILTFNARAEQLAKEYIAAGEVVAFHTETVYGLGADACNDEAVQRIFALKGRPADNPLIAHVHKDYDLSRLIDSEPPYAAALRKAFLPGALTMVYPSSGKVSRFVSCGGSTLAVRVPSSPLAQLFLRAVDIPIAAPSANLSKHVSPVSAQHVYDDFKGKIPLILDGGTCEGGIESTVLDCTGEVPQILRAGLVTREMIAAVAGDCGMYHMHEGEKPKSPGMAYKHYSPRCKTALFTADLLENALNLYKKEEIEGGNAYILCESKLIPSLGGRRTLDLGSTGEEMANRLYALLREGERTATLIIAIQPTEEGGVMDGVLNRIVRACGGQA